jgi:phosphotransferase system  glucose/maltose/N-acetylglucosamine-specific IIC component
MWEWLGSIIQIGTFISVCWFTFTDNITTAAYAWFIPLTAVVFWLCSVIFTFVCRLVTGRYPGEAKQARKSATEFLSSESKSSSTIHDQEL